MDRMMNDELGPLLARLTACAEDPMWPDHAEVPKALLRKVAEALEETASIAEHFMAKRDAERDELRATLTAVSDALDYLHGMTPEKSVEVQKYAERYRWLRDKSPSTWTMSVKGLPLFKGDFDAAIDREMTRPGY